MSVLIKGMEMPKNCAECPVNMNICNHGYEYLLEHQELYERRANNCPIIELPAVHWKTNADRIRAMSDKELAEFLNEVRPAERFLTKTWIEWLKKEVDK